MVWLALIRFLLNTKIILTCPFKQCQMMLAFQCQRIFFLSCDFASNNSRITILLFVNTSNFINLVVLSYLNSRNGFPSIQTNYELTVQIRILWQSQVHCHQLLPLNFVSIQPGIIHCRLCCLELSRCLATKHANNITNNTTTSCLRHPIHSSPPCSLACMKLNILL